MSALSADPEAALAFLDLLHPGGPWVLTAITPDGPATTETFSRADTVAKWILRENAARNIYIMVAEASGPLRKKATKADVARTYHLWADLDGGDDLRERLNGQVPPPTAIVASGGGLNVYWALAEPIADRLDIEAHTRWLAERLGADHCWNCDRILRLPGTINWPNKKKLSKGREPVLAQCTEFHPDRVYDFDDFGRIEASADGTEAKEGRPGIDDDTPLLTLDDLPAEVREKLPAWARRLIREGPGAEEYRDDRSKAVWAVACALVRAGASDSQIAGLLLNPDLPIHAHVRDQKGHGPRAYVARQIERARELVEEDPEPPPGSAKPNGQGEAAAKWFKFPWEFEPAKAPRLVKGLLSHGDEVLVYGPPEAGKTFFVVDLSCRWACGEPWRGHEVEHGLVIYLAGERKLSVQNRIRAWALRNGKRLEDVPVMVLDRPLNLLRPDDAEREAIAAEIQGASAERQLPVVAIVSDTVHSLSPGSKEDAHSFGVLMDQLRRLRDAIAQTEPIALIYVHHTGKDEDRGPRGGNALPAGMSLSIAISVRLEKYRLVEVDKNSDLAARPYIEPFVIEDVTIGHEATGEPIRFGVHVAIPITEVPNPPEHELKAMAVKMSRDGKSQRAIAKAVGRSVSTVNEWLQATQQEGSSRPRRKDSP